MEKTFEKRLCRAVELGFQKMETARKARYKFLAQYVGPFYSKNKGAAGSDERKASPLNLMYNAVTTMVPNLVYNDPRVKVRTEVLAYRNYAGTLELATNHLIRKIKLRHTLRKVITDALFCAGFVKTGLAVSGQTLDLEGKVHDIGEPFADRVDPDDMVIDPMARDWEEMSFVGNRFRMAKKLLLESGLYPNDKIEKLCSRYTDGKYRQEAASIAGDANIAQQYQDVAEYVDLVEVYLPQEQIILTIPYGIGYGEESVLRVVDYEGPEAGPYHMLGFAYVPQPAARRAGRAQRPDYALFADEKTKEEAYAYALRQEEQAFYARAVAVADAKYWERPLNEVRRDDPRDDFKNTNPSFQIVNYLIGTGVDWGILTNGRHWRLYSRQASSTATEFYEVDLVALLEAGDPEAFKRFWLFFRREAFRKDAQGRNFLERVREGSATYAQTVGDRLKTLVFQEVFPFFAGGFAAYGAARGEDVTSEEARKAIYEATLSFLYKLLFLFYAEARGLLPMDNPGYRSKSLTSLAREIADKVDRREPLGETSTDFYDRLLNLFRLVDQGDRGLGLPRYNGGSSTSPSATPTSGRSTPPIGSWPTTRWPIASWPRPWTASTGPTANRWTTATWTCATSGPSTRASWSTAWWWTTRPEEKSASRPTRASARPPAPTIPPTTSSSTSCATPSAPSWKSAPPASAN